MISPSMLAGKLDDTANRDFATESAIVRLLFGAETMQVTHGADPNTSFLYIVDRQATEDVHPSWCLRMHAWKGSNSVEFWGRAVPAWSINVVSAWELLRILSEQSLPDWEVFWDAFSERAPTLRSLAGVPATNVARAITRSVAEALAVYHLHMRTRSIGDVFVQHLLKTKE